VNVVIKTKCLKGDAFSDGLLGTVSLLLISSVFI
jgi:hypothetical protein